MFDTSTRRLQLGLIAIASLVIIVFAVSPDSLRLGSGDPGVDYPRRPVRVVVPFPAGGGTDAAIRLLTRELSERLGRPVIVENRPGAGSAIGSQYVASQRADGYTLLMASNSLVINKAVNANIAYNLSDFAPVILFANAPSVLVTSPHAPYEDARAMLQQALRRPDSVKYASFGRGSTPHIAAVNLEAVSGANLRHVPYAGGAPARTAVMSGESDLLISSIIPVASAIRNGSLKGLGIAAGERSPLIAEVPTFREQGIDLISGTWFGLMAPAGTPAAIVERLYREAADLLLHDEEIRRQMAAAGMDVLTLDAEAFTALMREELAQLEKLAARMD